jgi:hypothetical protein
VASRFRYVVDHGEIYRMTETRFRRYLLEGSKDEVPDASQFGVLVGAALTVNKLTPSDFSDLYNKLTREVLSSACPTCDAEPGELCCSLAKRWQAWRCRTLGMGGNGWRKTPHPERVKAWRAQRAAKAAAENCR